MWMSPHPGVGPMALGHKPRQEEKERPAWPWASPHFKALTLDLAVTGQKEVGA